MQNYTEALILNYRTAIVDFLKEGSIEYTVNDNNPNVIGTQIECEPANARFPLGITVTNDQMIWMVSLPPMPIAECKKEELNHKLKEINKDSHLLDFAVIDSGISGIVSLSIYPNDDAKQIVRNTYLIVKDDLEKSWLSISQAIFTNDGNSSALAQFKKIIESDKETINLTIEENTSFSGRRFNGRLLGYTYALVDTRSHGKSSISEVMGFKEKSAVEDERIELKELTFEGIRSALLKWGKSLSEVKSLCLRSGMDISKAQNLIDEVCSKIKEERNRKMKPYLLALATLMIIGVGLCFTKMLAFFFIIIIVFYFCIQKIYGIYKQYRIRTS